MVEPKGLSDLLAAGDLQLQIGAFLVHDVHVVQRVPAVLLDGAPVLFGGVAPALIGGVALHDGAGDVLGHGLPEGGAQEVLVAGLAGVDLDGHLAGQLLVQKVVQLHDLFGGNGAAEIYLGFHKDISCRESLDSAVSIP